MPSVAVPRDVKERLELEREQTHDRIEQTLRDMVRSMKGTNVAPGLSWDSPIVRTQRARLAASKADLAILETLLAGAL